MEYHIPVLATESIDALNIKPNGVYVDATFGGGGHSKLILDRLGENGHLLGFDQDEDAQANIIGDPRFTFVDHNFRYLKKFLKLHGHAKIDGVLADLGVSSHQLDEASRGFSYRFDADLDMRMDRETGQTAADLLNSLSAGELQDVFSKYGEVRNSKMLAQAIVGSRLSGKLQTVGDFLSILDPLIRGQRRRYLSQVFQAIRIAVNDEMGALSDFMTQVSEVLKPEGRFSVITYHSIEDRLVKRFLKTGNVEGQVEKDFYGNIQRPFKVITRKAILPGEDEVKRNPRARSAKLRIAEGV